MEHLFVYGTLRRSADHPMFQVLAAGAFYVGEARFQGRLYRVATYPGAVASGDPAERVVGEVYRLTDPATVREKLDAYEGIGPDFPQPTLYVRRLETVALAGGRQLQAWVYVYNRPVAGLERIVTGDFLMG